MYQAIILTNVKLNGPKQVLLRSDNKVLEKKKLFPNEIKFCFKFVWNKQLASVKSFIHCGFLEIWFNIERGSAEMQYETFQHQ